jgi:hypothetical protein
MVSKTTKKKGRKVTGRRFEGPVDTPRRFYQQPSNAISTLPDPTTPVEIIPNADGTMPDPHQPTQRLGRDKRHPPPTENPPANLYDLDPSKVQNLWERWPNEDEKAYSLFYVFLKMGPNRTIRAVAERVVPKNGNINSTITLVHRYSSVYKWDDRIIAYDRYMQRLEDEEVAKVRKDSAKKNAEILSKAEYIIENQLDAYLKQVRKHPNDIILKPPQLSKFIETLVEMRKVNENYRRDADSHMNRGPRKLTQVIVYGGAQDIKKEPKNVMDAQFEPVEEAKKEHDET